MKRILAICLTLAMVCCFFVNTIPAKAVSFTPSFDINSSAGLLINLDTDEVMYQKNADTQYMPGALVQIMEAIVVLENCSNLSMRITADESLYDYFKDSAYPDDLRYAEIKNHDILTVEELLYALMLTSSCEAAVLLANQFGNGSISNFVQMMNDKAAALGCTQTTFTNVTGEYSTGQKTTANDLALITKYALSLGRFETIACTANFRPTSPNPERHDEEWIWSHSNLMTQETSTHYMENVRGIKTANLSMQGRNIITKSSRDGNNFLVILLAAPFEDGEGNLQYYHMDDARALFDWVYEHFAFRTLLSDTTELGQVTVNNSEGANYVLVRPEKAFGTLWYDQADESSIVRDISLKEHVSAPVKKGDVLGKVTLKFSGEEIAEVNLIATTGVELSKFKYYTALVKHFPQTPWLTRAILFSILLCAIYIALCLYSHIQFLQRKKAAPIHLKPNSSAARKEAHQASEADRKAQQSSQRPQHSKK